MSWKKQMGTRHNVDCSRAFKNYDPQCPRCQELANGAEARQGWGPSRRELDLMAASSVSAHFSSERHLSGGCGVVCTYGEW